MSIKKIFIGQFLYHDQKIICTKKNSDSIIFLNSGGNFIKKRLQVCIKHTIVTTTLIEFVNMEIEDVSGVKEE